MTAGVHRGPRRVPRHRRPADVRRLTIYRRWATVFTGLTTYLLLLIVMGLPSRAQLHDPAFVFPTVAVLLAWWGAFTGVSVAWDRLKSARLRAFRRNAVVAFDGFDGRSSTPNAPAQLTCAGASASPLPRELVEQSSP